MNNQIQKLIQTFKHSKIYIKWFKFMRHHADSSLNHHDCNKKQTIDLDKILIFSLLLFFYFFLAFRECWLAKPILFQPTRKFKTSHLDKAKNYLENTDFEIVFSELDSNQVFGYCPPTCLSVRATLAIFFLQKFYSQMLNICRWR